MKRMTKSGIFTTAAVLVILSAMLVTGCSDTIVEKPSGYTPPAGMGAVRLKFSEHIERATILPDDATILSFVEFEFTFTPNSGGVFKEEQRTSATREDPIILAPGTYDLAVIAYLPPESSAPPGDPNRAAAVWSSPTPVPVTVGINSPISITLKPYDSVVATENGTFAWEIDNQINIPITSFTVAKMTVKNLFGIPIPSATASWNPVTFNLADPTWSGAGSIPSGFYYVDIELEIDGTMKYFRHVLHIYQNMTSTFTYTFTDAHIGVVGALCEWKLSYVHPEDDPPVLTVTPNTGNAADGSAAKPYLLALTGNIASPSSLDINTTNVTSIVVSTSNGTISLGTTPTVTITSNISPFDVPGTYQISVKGDGTDFKPYAEEIFVKVVAAPKLTLADTDGKYNPDNLTMAIGGGGDTITITLTSTASIPNGTAGFHPDINAAHNVLNLKAGSPGIDDGYTVVTLRGLYDIAVPITRTLYNQGINLYSSNPASAVDYAQTTVHTIGIRNAGDPLPSLDWAIILWNGAIGPDAKKITFVVEQHGVTTTYIIDWSGVTIEP